MVTEHFLSKINKSVTSRLSAGEGTAVGEALACQYSLIEAGYALILSVKEANFTSAYADISCRYVYVGAYVLVKLSHKALAESHNFAVGFALGIEIRTALAAPYGQSGKRIFEYLFKTKEFNYT